MNFAQKCDALLRAIIQDDIERVKQLLGSGIPVNTVLHSNTRREHATVLATAAYEGRDKIVQYLIDIKINLNFQDPCLSRNALHWAAMGGQYRVTKLLLENGMDINCKDRDNVTAVIRASIKGNIDIVKLLIEHGANVNHHDRLHSSALHYASFFGRSNIVALLIRSGCVQNSPAIFGQGTPLANLFYHGDSNNCKLLVECGYSFQNETDWLHNDQLTLSPHITAQPDLAAYLFNAMKNPLSLSVSCRKVVRDTFGGQSVQAKIKQLPLPKKMTHYLLLEDIA